MSIVKEYLQKFFSRKKYFRKTLVIFTVILLVCVISTATILTQSMKKPLQNSISKTHQTLLEQVRSLSDTYILNQIDTIIIQNFLNFQNNKEWNYFFTMDESSSRDMLELFNTYKYLSEIKNNYDFLDSLVIYNPKSRVIISSNQGVSMVDSHNILSLPAPVNLEYTQRFIESGETQLWVPPADNKAYFPDENMLTLICSVPVMRTADKFNGCVYFNINMNKLISYIDTFFTIGETQLMVVNHDGILFASNQFDMQKDEDFSWLTELAATSHEGLSTYNGQSVIWANSAANDWIYAAVLPVNAVYQDMIRSTQFAMWVTIAAILVAGTIVYLATLWLQKPLRKLLLNASERLPETESGDEFKMIDDVISQLSTRVTDLESTLDGNQDLIKNQIVMDILNGNISGIEEVRSRLSIVGIRNHYPAFGLIFTELNSHSLKRTDYEQREFIFYKTLNKLEDFWNKIGVCLSIRYNNYIISILAAPSTDYIEQINPNELDIGTNMNLGLCQPVDDILHLHADFQRLDVYMQYGFIYGYGNVFTYQDIDAYENSTAELPNGFIANIESLLKSGKTDEIKTQVQEAIHFIRTSGCSYHYTQSLLLQIINLLCQWSREQNFINDSFSKSKLISEFNSAENLDEFRDWINDLLDVYRDNFNDRSNSIKNEFVEGIAKYIVENITENLSLKSVADKFGISSSYLSKIFKETLDINFSVYLNTKKFEAAAEMLTHQEQLSVTEIAEKLGYYNMPYFNQQFKDKYGLSPLQYRKRHLVL